MIDTRIFTDSTRPVHIYSDGMLGRINDEGVYVIPEQVIKEIIDAPKYFTKRLGNRLYLYTHVGSLDRNLLLLMQYKINKAHDKIFFSYCVIEEEYLADGLTINSVLTEFAHSIYPFSSDVILRAFRDFHVYIRDEDEGGREEKVEDMPLLGFIVKYNEAIDEIAHENFERYYKTCFDKVYNILKSSNNPIYEKILDEYDKGRNIHNQFFKDELIDGDASYKAKMEILNNSIEKVIMSNNLDTRDISELVTTHKEVMSDFREQVQEEEKSASNTLIGRSNDQDATNFTTVIKLNQETEQIATQNSKDITPEQAVIEKPVDVSELLDESAENKVNKEEVVTTLNIDPKKENEDELDSTDVLKQKIGETPEDTPKLATNVATGTIILNQDVVDRGNAQTPHEEPQTIEEKSEDLNTDDVSLNDEEIVENVVNVNNAQPKESQHQSNIDYIRSVIDKSTANNKTEMEQVKSETDTNSVDTTTSIDNASNPMTDELNKYEDENNKKDENDEKLNNISNVLGEIKVNINRASEKSLNNILHLDELPSNNDKGKDTKGLINTESSSFNVPDGERGGR